MMTQFYIAYDKEKFLHILHEEYCKRAGIIPGSSRSAEELCRRLCDWLYGQRRFNSLLINGSPGTGKTTLVEALVAAIRVIAEERIAHNITTRISAVKMENKDLLEDGLCDLLIETQGLIIDDLGHESPVVKVWGQDYRPAETVIKQRSDKMLPTIVTTNLMLEQIERQYNSPRLADVLAQYDKMQITTSKSFRRL